MANVAHSGLTGADLHEPKGIAAATSGQVYQADGAGSGTWAALPSVTGVAQVGEIKPYLGSSAPSGYLLCYGQAVSRATYSALFAVTSTAWGVGDGVTTFNLPDLRGRSLFGDDNMGGSTAGRITSAGSGITGTTIGQTGGAETVTLARANLPNDSITSGEESSHTHFTVVNISSSTNISGSASSGIARDGDVGGNANDRYILGGSSAARTLGTTSGGTAHSHTVALNGGVTQTTVNKMPPAAIVSWIVYTGV